MKSLTEKYGEWALVTGASSGIGKEFALQLAKRSFNLVLVARREDRLTSLATMLESEYSIRSIVVPTDLSKPDFLEVLKTATAGIEVGLLINNAGFTITEEFTNSDIGEQQELIEVNVNAVLMLSHYFGNQMKVTKKGGIINIASAVAYLPVPAWSTYAASKAFVLHFSEALWYELKPYNVDVLALCPGATRTEFNDSSYLETGMSAAEVVKTGLKNLSKRPSVIAGSKNRFSIAILKWFGRKTLVKIGARITG